MAEQTTIVCDNPGGKRACKQPAHTWYLHQPHTETPMQVDLCNQHARALDAILAVARPVEVCPATPAPKPRHKGIALTPLRTTARTRALKV